MVATESLRSSIDQFESKALRVVLLEMVLCGYTCASIEVYIRTAMVSKSYKGLVWLR
jgi:hypothetical protein